MPRRPVTNRILLALQFWNGDRAPAMELARLIADLEETKCERADFLFSARFDTPQDPETIDYVSRKFNVYTLTSKRQGTGWPWGCNDLFHSTVEWAFSMIRGKKVPAYKSVLTFEADCCPMIRNWVATISDHWDTVRLQKNICLAGDLTPNPAWHVNGNCMVNAELENLQWLNNLLNRGTHKVGWDYHFRHTFEKRGWAAIPGFWSEYAVPHFPAERWNAVRQQGVIFHHGVKDDSLRAAARQKLLGAVQPVTVMTHHQKQVDHFEQKKFEALTFLKQHAPELLK